MFFLKYIILLIEMIMKKRLLLIPIVLNSFLLGCSSKQIFNEALEIEKRSLEQDYVSVTIHQTATAKKDGTSKSSKAQNEIIRFESDEGPCLIHIEDLKTSYYFPERAFSFQNSHPENVHYFETLETVNYRDVLKGNTLFDDIEQYIISYFSERSFTSLASVSGSQET